MKRIVFLISILAILNGCAQSTALLGPTYSMVKSESLIQVGTSFATSYGFKQAIDQTGTDELLTSLAENDIRECQTTHSTELNEIFFKTLDEFDCYNDPFSILR